MHPMYKSPQKKLISTFIALSLFNTNSFLLHAQAQATDTPATSEQSIDCSNAENKQNKICLVSEYDAFLKNLGYEDYSTRMYDKAVRLYNAAVAGDKETLKKSYLGGYVFNTPSGDKNNEIADIKNTLLNQTSFNVLVEQSQYFSGFETSRAIANIILSEVFSKSGEELNEGLTQLRALTLKMLDLAPRKPVFDLNSKDAKSILGALQNTPECQNDSTNGAEGCAKLNYVLYKLILAAEEHFRDVFYEIVKVIYPDKNIAVIISNLEQSPDNYNLLKNLRDNVRAMMIVTYTSESMGLTPYLGKALAAGIAKFSKDNENNQNNNQFQQLNKEGKAKNILVGNFVGDTLQLVSQDNGNNELHTVKIETGDFLMERSSGNEPGTIISGVMPAFQNEAFSFNAKISGIGSYLSMFINHELTDGKYTPLDRFLDDAAGSSLTEQEMATIIKNKKVPVLKNRKLNVEPLFLDATEKAEEKLKSVTFEELKRSKNKFAIKIVKGLSEFLSRKENFTSVLSQFSLFSRFRDKFQNFFTQKVHLPATLNKYINDALNSVSEATPKEQITKVINSIYTYLNTTAFSQILHYTEEIAADVIIDSLKAQLYEGFSHVGIAMKKTDSKTGISMVWAVDSYPNGGNGGVRIADITREFSRPGMFMKLGVARYNASRFLNFAKRQSFQPKFSPIDHFGTKNKTQEVTQIWEVNPTAKTEYFGKIKSVSDDVNSAQQWYSEAMTAVTNNMIENYLMNGLGFAYGFKGSREKAFCSATVWLSIKQTLGLESQYYEDQWHPLARILKTVKYPPAQTVNENERIIAPSGFAWQSKLVDPSSVKVVFYPSMKKIERIESIFSSQQNAIDPTIMTIAQQFESINYTSISENEKKLKFDTDFVDLLHADKDFFGEGMNAPYSIAFGLAYYNVGDKMEAARLKEQKSIRNRIKDLVLIK